MELIIQSNIYIVGIFIFGIFSLIVYQMITGAINLKGLLIEKDSKKSHGFSRYQLLLITISASSYYVYELIQRVDKGFPEVPLVLVLITGTSNSIYLWSKFNSLIVKEKKNKTIS